MREYVLIALLAVSLFLSSGVLAAEPVKIGVVDVQKIITKSKTVKKVQNEFSKEVEARRAVLAEKEKSVQKAQEELKRTRSGKSRLTEGKEKLKRETDELNKLREEMEKELRRKDSEITQKVMGEIRQIMVSLFKKEKYALIIEKHLLVASDDALDISEQVLKLYDERIASNKPDTGLSKAEGEKTDFQPKRNPADKKTSAKMCPAGYSFDLESRTCFRE
jgi:outer membrane protein